MFAFQGPLTRYILNEENYCWCDGIIKHLVNIVHYVKCVLYRIDQPCEISRTSLHYYARSSFNTRTTWLDWRVPAYYPGSWEHRMCWPASGDHPQVLWCPRVSSRPVFLRPAPGQDLLRWLRYNQSQERTETQIFSIWDPREYRTDNSALLEI